MQRASTWRNTGSPLPYIGPLDERRDNLGETHVVGTCGSDKTGEVAYQYNSLGFRCPEFRRDARLRIYTFGESDAFGLGLEVQDAWPSRLVEAVCKELGLAAEDVCHMNFAEPGASNDLISRMVVSQCGAALPDLVFVSFAEIERAEGICRGRVFCVGPWFHQSQDLRRTVLNLPEQNGQPHLFVEALHRGDGYLEFTNRDHSRLAALRNLLLVQSYLKGLELPAIATSRPLLNLSAAEIQADPIIGPLLEQVCPEFYRPFEWQWPPRDSSADGLHMGPKSHDRIANHMLACLRANGDLAAVRRKLESRA